jgi:hypothetical protein
MMVSCGAGKVEAFGATATGYRSLGTTETRPGTRTSLFVPEQDRLFVAVRAASGSGAEVRVYRPT